MGKFLRILKPGGELYTDIVPKRHGLSKMQDIRNLITTLGGSKRMMDREKDIPFHVNLDDIIVCFLILEIVRIRYTDDCYFAETQQNSKAYFILAKLKE